MARSSTSPEAAAAGRSGSEAGGCGGKGGNSSPTRSRSRLEKIWIVALGSRGDIQPYLAVGAAMAKRGGYEVTFLTNGSYAKMAENYGMRGVPLCDDFEASLESNEELNGAMMDGNAARCFAGIAETHRQNAPSVCDAFVEEIRTNGVPDLCAAMPFAHYVAWYLFVRYSVPYFQMTTFPVAYNPNHVFLNMPNCLRHFFGLGYYLLHDVVMGLAYDGYRAYDDYLMKEEEEEAPGVSILEEVTRADLVEHYKRPKVPIAALLSPEIGRVLYSERHTSPMIRFVGTTVLDSEQQQQQGSKFGDGAVLKSLDEFLRADGEKKEPVVYLGWGSMVTASPEYMAVWCVRAVRRAGQRAVVLGGNAVLALETLERAVAALAEDGGDDGDGPDLVSYARQNILFVDKAPHEWLFPRVACTVHHGGAGTTTAALRSGRPTIVTPVFGDQYDFSYAVRELGVGIGFERQLHRIGWRELGDAIRDAVQDEGMKERAGELGARLRAEDGASRTVDEMESFWEEFCLTGRYREVFPAGGNKEDKSALTSRRTVYAALTIGSLAIAATIISRRRFK